MLAQIEYRIRNKLTRPMIGRLPSAGSILEIRYLCIFGVKVVAVAEVGNLLLAKGVCFAAPAGVDRVELEGQDGWGWGGADGRVGFVC